MRLFCNVGLRFYRKNFLSFIFVEFIVMMFLVKLTFWFILGSMVLWMRVNWCRMVLFMVSIRSRNACSSSSSVSMM